MLPPDTRLYDDSWNNPLKDPALVVSAACSQGDLRDQLAFESYSYRIVARAFAPLLRRWGHVQEIDHPESRLDFALRQLRLQGKEPLHLGFYPLHRCYLTPDAPNVAFPFWEFPEIPNSDQGSDMRDNWVRVANCLSHLLVACTFTREAFTRAGVRIPVHVVPVPIRSEYFDVPAWEPGQRVRLDCPAYVFGGSEPMPVTTADAVEPGVPAGIKQRLRRFYKRQVRPRMPVAVDWLLTRGSRCGRRAVQQLRTCGRALSPPPPILATPTPSLDLSGIVYTVIFNPYDQRKNWMDLLTAFLLTLGDRPDATLVFKLGVKPDLTPDAVNGIISYYRGLSLPHRCKLAVITEYLTDEQMVELTRASTFHLNATRAEGANLPLQDFLAAGRPGVSPRHTAMCDYFHDEMGFVVASHPEPTRWPHLPELGLTTSWHHPVWESLCAQLQASYETAKQHPRAYQIMASRSREQIEDYASAERVWPRLVAALNAAARDLVQPQPREAPADARREPRPGVPTHANG